MTCKDATVRTFGDALRAVIYEKVNETIHEFAGRTGLSTATLNRAFKAKGKKEPGDRKGMHPSTYREIAKGAGMTVEQLDAFVAEYCGKPATSAKAADSPDLFELIALAIAKAGRDEVIRTLRRLADTGSGDKPVKVVVQKEPQREASGARTPK